MKFKPITIATFNQLECVEWFSRVGTRDSQSAAYVSSWDEALRLGTAREWENTRLEASNALSRDLAAYAPKRYRDWNKTVDLIKEFTIPWVKEKIAKTVAEIQAPKDFEDAVQWDIVGLGLEAEYSDVVPPGFYVGIAHFYMKGHFPCGWEGDWPSGKLIIW